MILNNSPSNEAIMSDGISQVTEFKIKATAKSFKILSSGLYSNKIRAIIRELSTNALDSQVDNGNPDTPFDVHLPNSMEPWFSIRDYGTGLTNEQVTNIFSSFFDSSKTGSNDFVGALGLGSKSPFSYTDNFTVIAIKNGKRGVYTAFINDHGVPSIATMVEEDSDEPTGVEIRFAVEKSHDYQTFGTEAQYVYEYFKHRPIISGRAGFKFIDPVYMEQGLIPGVHLLDSARGYHQTSYAIMGNIKYPIDEEHFDDDVLRNMLRCGLVMEFNIGELDFQASREGLSYIPETIAAIKTKLISLQGQLETLLAKEVTAKKHIWNQAEVLRTKSAHKLWYGAVMQYITNNKFPLLETRYGSLYHKTVDIHVSDLAEKYNIVVTGIANEGYSRAGNLTSSVDYGTPIDKEGKLFARFWVFQTTLATQFVINDTKTGARERARYHFIKSGVSKKEVGNVYILSPVDKTKPMKTAAFFKAILNPPKSLISNASELAKPETAPKCTVSIVQLCQRDPYWNNSKSMDMVWRSAGTVDSITTLAKKRAENEAARNAVAAQAANVGPSMLNPIPPAAPAPDPVFYYLPLKGHTVVSDVTIDADYFSKRLTETGMIPNLVIYGVRKSDIKEVESLSNWINLETHVREELAKLTDKDILGSVKHAIDLSKYYSYDVVSGVNKDSPYMSLYEEFKDVKVVNEKTQTSRNYLINLFKITTGTKSIEDLTKEYNSKLTEILVRYPLINALSNYAMRDNPAYISEYINAIDLLKGN